jgi:16S rRNA (cytidine1402-2'-O)-methyltransferase
MTTGESIALVSDAGTPGIADPGASLVRLAREAGVRVVPIPGPSAIIAALSASGVPASDFRFLGFPPSSGAARERWLQALATSPMACVFFEAPHRIARSLRDIDEYCAERPILVHREITKLNEQIVAVTRAGHDDSRPVLEKGEFVVVVGPSLVEDQVRVDSDDVLRMFDRLTQLADLDTDAALIATAALFSSPLPAVKKAVKKARISAKQRDRSSS